jgi:hypothetical protein
MNISFEILKPLADYLIGGLDILSFRDAMVRLRLSANGHLGREDKLFLNELEGRYAEFSDGLLSEVNLKNILRSLTKSAALSSSQSVLNDVFITYISHHQQIEPETSTTPVFSSIFDVSGNPQHSSALNRIEFEYSPS